MVTRKTALVTGGARGIGRACARALATAGYDIAIVDGQTFTVDGFQFNC